MIFNADVVADDASGSGRQFADAFLSVLFLMPEFHATGQQYGFCGKFHLNVRRDSRNRVLHQFQDLMLGVDSTNGPCFGIHVAGEHERSVVAAQRQNGGPNIWIGFSMSLLWAHAQFLPISLLPRNRADGNNDSSDGPACQLSRFANTL